MPTHAFWTRSNEWLKANLKWLVMLLLVGAVIELELTPISLVIVGRDEFQLTARIVIGVGVFLYALIHLWRLRTFVDEFKKSLATTTTGTAPLSVKVAICGVGVLLFRIIIYACATAYLLKSIWIVRPTIIATPSDPSYLELLMYCTRKMSLNILSILQKVMPGVRLISFNYFDLVGGVISIAVGIIWTKFVWNVFQDWISLSKARARNFVLVPMHMVPGGIYQMRLPDTKEVPVLVDQPLFWTVLIAPLIVLSLLSLAIV
jgi:hypothetical protein